jgi:hypothetical protein
VAAKQSVYRVPPLASSGSVLTLAPPEARMNIAARREPAGDPLTPAGGLGVAEIAHLEVFDTMAGAEAIEHAIFVLRTPWRPVYHVIFAAYAGVIGESIIIIDIDHWRHDFLILGALWGLMAATNRAVAAAPADVPARDAAGRSVARVAV